MGHPWPLFVYFCSFQTSNRLKIVDFSRIWTRIVRREGEHADHLTTTTAHSEMFVSRYFLSIFRLSLASSVNSQDLSLPTYLLTYIITYLPTHSPTYLPIYLPTYLSTYLPTHIITYLSTFLPTYLPIYILTYLPYAWNLLFKKTWRYVEVVFQARDEN